MRFLALLLIAVVVGVVSGLGSAWLAVGEGFLFRTYRAGDWTAWPEGGASNPDPYARALLARTAQLPLGSSEGIAFYVSRDAEGSPLRGGCDYVMTGETPAARLWTLSVVDARGDLPAHPSGRTFLHSREVLRRGDGRMEIALAPQARPGNWMPIPESGSLTVIMRFYESGASNPKTAGDIVLPRIEWRSCR